ncbi:putative Late nodulin [Medicago truncatula]|uniref:Late nodulin n=1 Tax=Medicago truncatula TaxID=3880 RepID=A0A072TGQ3_MEDTR|nr:late nodulin [Medicago truncatula]RHN79203.1 putative Late nodulin [Medicago truncatula]
MSQIFKFSLIIFFSLLLVVTNGYWKCTLDNDCPKNMCLLPQIAQCVKFNCECKFYFYVQ